MSSNNGHHIWCNYWNKPVETCEMCKSFNKKYPMEGSDPMTVMKEHWPDNVARTSDPPDSNLV